MILRFKLNAMFQGGIERVVPVTGPKKGTQLNKRKVFLPNKIYRVNDPYVIQYVKGEIHDCREKMVLTAALKEQLEAYNIEYTVKKCGTCTNAKPKAFFNPFEIVEEIEDDN